MHDVSVFASIAVLAVFFTGCSSSSDGSECAGSGQAGCVMPTDTGADSHVDAYVGGCSLSGGTCVAATSTCPDGMHTATNSCNSEGTPETCCMPGATDGGTDAADAADAADAHD
jgi:hypothetical protein